MKKANNTDSYKRFYTDMNFERAGLFELIKGNYSCETVLYPGCSIHITPSFYFQHVVYVDMSETAKSFFQNTEDVLSFINSNKKYKQSAYVQFLHNDYTEELSLRKSNYDLLIAIYAGGISKSCKKYIKSGGIIVSNNHQNDVRDTLKNHDVKLEATIYQKGKKYHLEKGTHETLLKVLEEHKPSSKNMRKSSNGLEYVDYERYFVMRKI